MKTKKEIFKKTVEQKGDEALLDIRYIGVSPNDVIEVYHELGMDPPIIIKKNTWSPTFMEKGWGNGYVRIVEGHPFYDKGYENIPVSVHGGLTFSEHVMDSTHFSDGYWVGFDTAHYGDNQETCTMDYVMDETCYLFKQIYM